MDERALLRYGDAGSPEVRNLLESKGLVYYEYILDPADADEVIVIKDARNGRLADDASSH